MPAATSPYQNNDYQAVSTFRPYQLPVNDIFKAISAQNLFWEEGARRVKSVYENALGLNLVTDANRKIRDDFMKEAEKQITKLSSMDLSDPAVQRQGIGVFRPLLQDQDIVGEDYVVRNLNKELGIGQSYRTKDDGKGYNPLSIENIEFERGLLRTALNKRNGWKALYNNMSTYTPNSDIAGELKKITDLVKAKEIETATIEGNDWYISEINRKGVSKDRILAAIQEMGSPQLKAQMRVEGRNTFYNQLARNPAGVDGYFQGVAANLYRSKINDLENSRAEIYSQMYMIPDNKDNRTKRDRYQAVYDDLGKTIMELRDKEMPKGVAEFSDLTNMDKLSSSLSKIESLWQSASINQLAPQLAWESSSQKIKPNTVRIAQETARLAAERIQLGYYDLEEEKRSNLADEADKRLGREIQLLELQGKVGAGASTNTDVLFEGATGQGARWTPTSGTSEPNEANRKDLQASARERMLGPIEEKVRESAVSNILGENTWSALERNKADARTIGENGVLTDSELDKAAKFFKAFADSNAGKQVPGLYFFPNGTEDQYRRFIESIPIDKFKRMMGNMARFDVKFTGDLINKIAESGSEEEKRLAGTRAASFRADINATIRRDLNLSKIILPKQPAALGEYAGLFDSGGKVPLTDNNILKAFNRGIANNTLKVYTKSVIEDLPGKERYKIVQKPVSKEEYDKGVAKGDPSYREEVPSLKEFTNKVRERTDPLFESVANQPNSAMTTYIFPEEKGAEVQKLRKLQSLSGLVQSQASDNKKDVDNVLDFIKNRGKYVVGYNAFTKEAGESLPSIQILMEGLPEADQEAWEKLKNTKLPALLKAPEAYQTGNISGNFRFRGAVLAVAPINNDENGMIRITNQSDNISSITPEIEIDDVYTIDETGDITGKKGGKIGITKSEVTRLIEKKIGPIGSLLDLDPDLNRTNTLLAAYITSIEIANNDIKERLNKKNK